MSLQHAQFELSVETEYSKRGRSIERPGHGRHSFYANRYKSRVLIWPGKNGACGQVHRGSDRVGVNFGPFQSLNWRHPSARMPEGERALSDRKHVSNNLLVEPTSASL